MKVWKSFVRKSEIEEVSFSQAVAKQFSGFESKRRPDKICFKKIGF